LRGVAILMVVLFHGYARWPKLYPYGAAFVGNPVFNTQSSGVYLFFIISGFVILMSLDRSRSFAQFIYHRWLRLFPAMLICSAIILATAWLFPERPRGAIGLADTLPGLLLLGDPIWQGMPFIGQFHPTSIEGAFWSLYVEVRYYLLIGLLYFAIGRRAALITILTLTLYRYAIITAIALHGAGLDFTPFALVRWAETTLPLRHLLETIGVQHFVWFFIGSTYYLYVSEHRLIYFAASLLTSLVAVIDGIEGGAGYVFVVTLFAAAVWFGGVKRLLAGRIFLLLGFVSYPLYLLHENMLVASVVKLGWLAPGPPWAILPLIPIAGLIGLAYLVARFAEPALKSSLKRGVSRLRLAAS
jgi:peptidoglycan/LPS O-acetylase OafA/YrhL